MALRGLEKLKSTFVLVPPEGEFAFNLNPAEIAKHLREPQVQPIALGTGGVQVVSVRDQIVVRIAGRIDFEDQSDVQPPGSARLPEVVNGFIQMFKDQQIGNYRAYGWNFDVTFDAPGDMPASAIIADRFLNKTVLEDRAQITPAGAGLTLTFFQANARCQLKLEGRSQDIKSPQFYSTINYHYELSGDEELPSLEDLRLSYHGLWGSYQDLLDKLVKP